MQVLRRRGPHPGASPSAELSIPGEDNRTVTSASIRLTHCLFGERIAARQEAGSVAAQGQKERASAWKDPMCQGKVHMRPR